MAYRPKRRLATAVAVVASLAAAALYGFSAATAASGDASPPPQNPFLAPNGLSQVHEDAYASNRSPWAGPTGPDLTRVTRMLGRTCRSLLETADGRLLAACAVDGTQRILMLAPHTLSVIGEYPLPGHTSPYMYLDNKGRVVLSTADEIRVLAIGATTLTLQRSYDISAVGNDPVVAVLPDWSGHIWFVSAHGTVGYVNPTTSAVRSLRLAGEAIKNSIATDETGGVFVVTDQALYRFDIVLSLPVVTWRIAYRLDSADSLAGSGSGTTPTVISANGQHYVAIGDNTSSRLRVLVYDAERGSVGLPLCNLSLFTAGHSLTQNSLISAGSSLIVENNAGYSYTHPDSAPGVARVDVDYANGGCHVGWEDHTVSVPTSLSKASVTGNTVYVYERTTQQDVAADTGNPATPTQARAYYLTALSLTTGARVSTTYIGTGSSYDNRWSPVTLTRDGTAYVPVQGGVVAVGPSAVTNATFHPLSPRRVLDTRSRVGMSGPVPALTSAPLSFPASIVPASATSVVLNVTAVSPRRAGFITVFPTDESIPTASDVNFATKQTVASLVTVQRGSGGRVSFYNSLASPLDLVADIAGYYTTDSTGSRFRSTAPTRVLDSRSAKGLKAAVPAGGVAAMSLPSSVVPAGATAVVMNVTVVRAGRSGYLTVFPGKTSRPLASNLNFAPGATVANLVTVRVGAHGAIAFANGSSLPVHVVGDVAGYFTSSTPSSHFHSLSPVRVLDTRVTAGAHPAPPHGSVTVTFPVSLLPVSAAAVVVNVAAATAHADGYLTVFPAGTVRPLASNLNFRIGQTVGNHATVRLHSGGLSIYNSGSQALDVVVDLAGYYD